MRTRAGWSVGWRTAGGVGMRIEAGGAASPGAGTQTGARRGAPEPKTRSWTVCHCQEPRPGGHLSAAPTEKGAITALAAAPAVGYVACHAPHALTTALNSQLLALLKLTARGQPPSTRRGPPPATPHASGLSDNLPGNYQSAGPACGRHLAFLCVPPLGTRRRRSLSSTPARRGPRSCRFEPGSDPPCARQCSWCCWPSPAPPPRAATFWPQVRRAGCPWRNEPNARSPCSCC